MFGSEAEAVAVVGMDTAVGILAGMVTFPVVMSFGLKEVISGSTLGTIFIALPTGLASLGAAGQLVPLWAFLVETHRFLIADAHRGTSRSAPAALRVPLWAFPLGMH